MLCPLPPIKKRIPIFVETPIYLCIDMQNKHLSISTQDARRTCARTRARMSQRQLPSSSNEGLFLFFKNGDVGLLSPVSAVTRPSRTASAQSRYAASQKLPSLGIFDHSTPLQALSPGLTSSVSACSVYSESTSSISAGNRMPFCRHEMRAYDRKGVFGRGG